MDLGNHVDTCWRESLRALGPCEISVPHLEVGPRHTASLKGDRRQRVEEAGEEVERLLVSDPPLHREDWH